MKNKLRKIIVFDRTFFWNFKDKLIRKKETADFIAESILTIFPAENKKSKITVTFQTKDNLYTGNPLMVGTKNAGLAGKVLNLNYPSIVSKIIEFLITNKIWSGENPKPASIEGLKILSELGYEIENLKPVEDRNKYV